MNTDRIQTLLQDIRLVSERNHAILQQVRRLALAAGDGVSEEVKYGGILFSTTRSFCGVFSYANHVTLEFSAGASLPDPFHMLEGQGKLRRHIKLQQLEDMADRHVADYIALACAAASSAA